MDKLKPAEGLDPKHFPALVKKGVDKGTISYHGDAGGKPGTKGYVCPPPDPVKGGKR